jgi:hypothetical protein
MATEKIRYFQMGSGNTANVARMVEEDEVPQEFTYLDHTLGLWMEHASVVDSIYFEPNTHEITLKQAKALVKRLVPTLEPDWLGETDQ